MLTTRIVSQAQKRAAKRARRSQLQERDRFNHQTRDIAIETLRAHFAEEEEEARRYVLLLTLRSCMAFLDSELRRQGAYHD